MTPRIEGVAEPRFSAVADAFARAFDDRPQMGAALAIRHRGRLVVDLWGGTADAVAGTPWARDTVSVIFSCTKGLVSALVALLVEQGRLDYAARVTDVWPEFGAEGKGDVTVAELLAHRAGLSAPRIPVSRAELLDWERMTDRLAAQEPLWSPGHGYAYHALTHGWLAGELVRRVTGDSVGAFFREAMAGPLGADAWIGLPASEQHRVAEMLVGPTLAELTRVQEAEAPMDRPDWNGLAMTLGGALPRELVAPGDGFNAPEVRAAEIPGAGGVASARALATIWSATVVETEGVRLLADRTLDDATRVESAGPPVFDVPPPWPRWGRGLQLDSEARRYLGPGSFGHDGAGGQVAFADRQHEIGFAFLTSQMEAIDDVRATRIVDALREAI